MKRCAAILIVFFLLFGCIQGAENGALSGGKAAVPAPAGKAVEPIGGGAVEKSEAVQKPSPGCGPQKERRFGQGPYYEGQLIDAHLHMPSLFPAPSDVTKHFNPAVLGRDTTMEKIICLLDREGISKAIGFFLAIDFLLEPSLQVARGAKADYPGRVEPFLMPAPLTRPTFTPDEYAIITVANPGIFRGYGELAFYFGAFGTASPDDEIFMGIYKVAQSNGHPVMIHPTPQTMEALEIAIQKNPDVIFLLHGHEVEDEIMSLAEKYANVYYSLDAALFPALYRFDREQDFKANFEENFDSLLEADVAKWKGHIEANPDSFVWGTDRGETWHFDGEVGDYLAEFSRAFIGRLSPDVQEKFAYKNAQRMLAGEKTGIKNPVAPITKTPFKGMEGLCQTEEKCNAFCKDNLNRCKQYCESHPEYTLCKDGFSFQ